MGMFATNDSNYSTGNIYDLMNDNTLQTYDNMSIMEACYSSIAVTESNWNAIMEAAAATEINYLLETGEEYVYTEASGFFASVVEFFKKIWEKIKALFKKFIMMMNSLFRSDKDFVKKYKEQIRRSMNNVPDDATIKGFEYTNMDTDKTKMQAGTDIIKGLLITKNDTSPITSDNYNKTTSIAAAAADEGWLKGKNIDDDNYDSTATTETLRGKIANAIFSTGKNTISVADYTESEFRDELYRVFRGGDDTPDNIDLTDDLISTAINDLEESKKTIDNANKLYKDTEKGWKEVMKTSENIEKALYKDKTKAVGDIKVLTRCINLAKSGANCISIICSMYCTALKEKYAQQKRICVKVLTYKPKNEGAFIEHVVGNDMFSSINLL